MSLLLREYQTNRQNLCYTLTPIVLAMLLALGLSASTVSAQTFTCDAVTAISLAECEALVQLYHTTQGQQWDNNQDWLQDKNPCNWYGILCEDGEQVTRLSLPNNNLVGSLPVEMEALSHLTTLNLADNSLQGNLPSGLTNLTQLEQFYFNETALCSPLTANFQLWLHNRADWVGNNQLCKTKEGRSALQNNLNFAYGIQIAPDHKKIDQVIADLKFLNMEWVKVQIPWKDMEPTRNADWKYHWWGDVIKELANNDFKILVSVSKAPAWARDYHEDFTVEGMPKTSAMALYANFVAELVNTYPIDAVEVWHEQNLWYEVGGRGHINAQKYTRLLQLTYIAVKVVKPEVLVISGGLAPAGHIGDLAVDDMDYLRLMYQYGAKGYMDAVGAHPYGHNCPALADWQTITPQEATANPGYGLFTNRHRSWCFLGTMTGYRKIMLENNDSNTQIIPTEFGWAVSEEIEPGYEYAKDNTPEEQAQWIMEAYNWAQLQSWVGPMFLWNLDYGYRYENEPQFTIFSIRDKPVFEMLNTQGTISIINQDVYLPLIIE